MRTAHTPLLLGESPLFWFKLCLAIAGVALVIAGLGLVRKNGRPSWLDTLHGWLLNHDFWEFCSRPWKVERFVYRHHRLFGGTISAGALTLLGLLYSWHNRLPGMQPQPLGPGVHVAELAAWTIATAVLVIGIAMFIRPSVLKGVEAISNRWIELPLPRLGTTRPIGILLTLLGLACIAAAWMAGA